MLLVGHLELLLQVLGIPVVRLVLLTLVVELALELAALLGVLLKYGLGGGGRGSGSLLALEWGTAIQALLFSSSTARGVTALHAHTLLE